MGFAEPIVISSSEGTSKMSGDEAFGRALPTRFVLLSAPPSFGIGPSEAVGCFRGRSGDGASSLGVDDGAGTSEGRDDFP